MSVSGRQAGRRRVGWRGDRRAKLCEPEVTHKEEDMERLKETGQEQKTSLS